MKKVRTEKKLFKVIVKYLLLEKHKFIDTVKNISERVDVVGVYAYDRKAAAKKGKQYVENVPSDRFSYYEVEIKSIDVSELDAFLIESLRLG